VSIPRWLPWALFVVLSCAALAFTPISAGFALRPAFECEVLSRWQLWIDALANVRHLTSFAVLTVVAAWAFRRRGLWLAAATVLAITVVVELEQMVFADGHCRLHNLLPNVIAIGVAVALVVAHLLRRRPA
jgi:hypothetical protein